MNRVTDSKDNNYDRIFKSKLNRFTYLFKQVDKPELDYDCVEGNICLLATSIIIKDETVLPFKYIHFDHPDDYKRCFSDIEVYNTHEVILYNMRQKPKFDIDGGEDKNHGNIINAIYKAFEDNYGMWPDIRVIDSVNTDPNEKKLSRHIIITNYAFEDTSEARYFTEQCVRPLLSTEDSKCLDDVNKKTQNFRIVGSTNTKGRRLELGFNNLTDTLVTYAEGLPILPRIAINDIPKVFGELPADVENIIAECRDELIGWNYRGKTGNILNFNRTNEAQRHCEFCNTDHDKDNTRYLLIKLDGIYLRCTKNKGRAERQIVNYAIKLPREPITAAANNITTKISDEYTDIVRKFAPDNVIIYDEPVIRPFSEISTVYVRANMKMGKTTTAKEYMKQFTTIVMVSFRRTFTREMTAVMKDLDIVSYLDIRDKQIDLKKTSRVIIQAESLYKLKLNDETQLDLLLLDESESIFDEFMSPTMKKANQCAATFEWLLENAFYCLIMDANLSTRTVDLVRKARSTDEQLIVNKYKNMTGDTINIMSKAELIDRALTSVKNGEKIIVPTNSKIFGESLQEMINRKYPAARVLLIKGNMDDEEKEEIFADVNAIWARYDAVIFTPAVSAGVSFTIRGYFQRVFAYFTNESNDVASMRQSLYRARDVALREYNVCLDIRGGRSPIKTIEEMREYMSDLRNTEDIETDLFAYKIRNGRREFAESFLLDIWMHGRLRQNISRCNMREMFVSQCEATGAKINYILDEARPKLLPEYNAVIKDIRIADRGKIVAAADITQKEFKILNEQHRKSEAEKYAIQKYLLKVKYKVDAIDEQFIETYGSQSVSRIYGNLYNILQSDSHKKSLENIQKSQRERNKEDNKLPAVSYLQHKIAYDFITICGYSGLLDNERVLSRDDLTKNLNSARKQIEDSESTICKVFNDKIPLKQPWSLDNALNFINGILTSMYGMSITPAKRIRGKRLRDSFVLKHKKFKKIFADNPKEDKPYIEVNWKYKDNGLENL